MRPSFQADWVYFRRLLIAAAILGFGYIAWSIAGMFFLVFAAILIAVLLSGCAELVRQYAGISHGAAIATSILAVATVLGVLIAFFGAQFATQLNEVFQRAPQALDLVGSRFGVEDAAARLQKELSSNPSGQLLSRAASIGYTFIGGLADILLVIVAAVYLAVDPQVYRTGLVKLFPTAQHHYICDTMNVTAAALRLWFLGQLVSMLLVGVLSGVAFWLIGFLRRSGSG